MKYLIVFTILIFVVCGATITYFYVDINEENTVKKVKIQVTIQGAVIKPNSYYLDSKSSLLDLINKAGGFTVNADLKNIDLRVLLKPNETYSIPYEINRIKKININAVSSSKKLIKTVKSYKLKMAIADSIINYIKTYGNFTSWKEVGKIKGVGTKTLTELRKYFFIA